MAVDVQVRAKELSYNIGIGIIGASYSISGGIKGVQNEVLISAVGIAAKISYSTWNVDLGGS